jgi:ketosteroid isomerase-like protein
MPAVLELLDEDIAWHVPGRSPLSGDYRGRRSGSSGSRWNYRAGRSSSQQTRSSPTATRVVVLSTVSAQRNGRALSTSEVHCWRVVDGKAVEFPEYQGDQQSEGEFWLS